MSLDISELSCHLAGQLVAAHPAYDALFDGFTLAEDRGNKAAREEWACGVLFAAAKASKWLGLTAHARPAGLIETAFAELGRRWLPILDASELGRRWLPILDASRVAWDRGNVSELRRRVALAADGVGQPARPGGDRRPKFNAHDWETRQSFGAFMEMGEGTISEVVVLTQEKLWHRKHTKLADKRQQAIAASRYASREEGY
ncbi:hypothetical protein GLOTRDRAFT_132885 [Gloeophyllum trabeum ATCC 11539]|uniref:Uncharacterized protein n=1 Tax=Gloeophyllum trabeum (strain ATCC 11539 / FP-39264 / Madison 617) TaxID=670483 RepID=S7PVJ8_GLOTA|nr:uncharacterized protein GLOTRDRAFT_132885 [Gloeophyllum trabeum ATCC 11539]EPQ51518.1 hypothetical protein GLOTRDRAFT_132885 [Gloeophyllum trabeum ATCC 11539]